MPEVTIRVFIEGPISFRLSKGQGIPPSLTIDIQNHTLSKICSIMCLSKKKGFLGLIHLIQRIDRRIKINWIQICGNFHTKNSVLSRILLGENWKPASCLWRDSNPAGPYTISFLTLLEHLTFILLNLK